MMTIPYSLDRIDSMVFESDEPVDLWQNDAESAYMLTADEIVGMPDDGVRQITELRMRLSELFETKFNASYAQLESACGIGHSSFQKVLRVRNGRNITYNLLAKFCVGARLSVEDARELFLMMGYVLNDKNRSDYILMCELQKHCSIEEYDKDLRAYGLDGILSSPE